MLRINPTNEFVVKFANVNGSGSASANLIFAKTLFRMGVPVSPKNIFPSNIQGLPTWYEIRASEAGYLARRAGVDLMVAMNAQTYQQDIAELCPGGVLFYDTSLPRRFDRADIKIIGLPLAEICAAHYDDARQRQLFKNMIYVGALSHLMALDQEVLKGVVEDQFKAKPKLIAPNLEALELGRAHAERELNIDLPFTVCASERAKGKIMMTGNDAAGLGCIYGGATVAAWYPITPSTSLPEAYEKYLYKFRKGENGDLNGAIIQAEDELSAIGMVIGANWNGARAFTATSGPGVSLMTEFLGLAYFAEVPVVLFNIQRGGPSTGMPTRTQQSDILACAHASHGDTKHILLFPADPKECFEMAAQAFDLAERLQTPVIVMSDIDIGMNDWVIDPLTWDDERQYDRGKVLDHDALEKTEKFGRYLDVDGDGIPYRTLPGAHPEKGAFFTRGSSHDAYAGYTENGEIHAEMLDRLNRKFYGAANILPAAQITTSEKPTDFGIIYFGASEYAVQEAQDILADQGIYLNRLKIRAFPFDEKVEQFIDEHEQVFVVEQNRDGQMRSLLLIETERSAEKLIPLLNYDGLPLTAAYVVDEINKVLAPNITPQEHAEIAARIGE